MDLLRPVRWIDRKQRLHTASAVAVGVIKKFGDDQAGNLAAAVAFYAFFSIFPLLLVFMTVLGYVLAGDHALMESVKHSVLGQFPVIGTSIDRSSLKGSAAALVIGIVLSLYSSLGITSGVTNAFDQIWEIPRREREDFLRKKLKGFLLIVSLGTLFTIAAGISGVVSEGLGGGALLVFGLIVSFLLNVGLFLLAFHFLCSQPPPWRSLLPGAIMAALLWTLLQALGGVYINHIKHSNSSYGTFALVLGFLAWLHLGAQATLYSAELNTVLAMRRWPRALLGQDQFSPTTAGARTDASAEEGADGNGAQTDGARAQPRPAGHDERRAGVSRDP